MIHGRVMASKTKTMQDAIEFASKLMDKRSALLLNARLGTRGRHGEKKHYGGSKSLCARCNYHHDGPCAPKCHKCNRVGHLAHDCRSSTNANTAKNQRGTGASQKATCYECGNQGHYRIDCLERKNQNHENQTGGTGARGVVHALGGGETDQYPNNIKDEIEA
ncbi:putative reverse transcriptase domain-containing protein [Tanacetum coccineum]